MTQADGSMLIVALPFSVFIFLLLVVPVRVIETLLKYISNTIDRCFVRLYLKVLVTDLDVYVSIMSSVPIVHTNHQTIDYDSVVFKSTQSASPPGEHCIATVKAPVALFTPCGPHISIIKRKFFDECTRLSRETRIGTRTFQWAKLKVIQLDIQSGPVHEWKRFVYF